MKTLTRILQAALTVLFPSAPDDLMVIAEATGVAAGPQSTPIHVDAEYAEMVIDWHSRPAHRQELSDPALEQMLLAWSQAAAGGDDK